MDTFFAIRKTCPFARADPDFQKKRRRPRMRYAVKG
jgi:hypothetical protein